MSTRSGLNQVSLADQDDQGLIQSIGAGQSAALSILYDRYGRLAFSLAVNIVGDAALAEEITQDVFLQIWNKAATYNSLQGKVVTWLASVTRHRAIDILRRQGARPEGHQVELEDGLPAFAPEDEITVENSIEFAQEKRRIQNAITRLPPEQQKVLALAYFKGLTHQEIAETCGEPLGTVKTRIRLAMQKMRQILEEND
jgi:RNA polymerase sigma-70 factor (ECF subfamily)